MPSLASFLSGLLKIIVAIPIFLVLGSKLQLPASSEPPVNLSPAYATALSQLGYHQLGKDEYLLTKNLWKSKGKKSSGKEKIVIYSLNDGTFRTEKTDQNINISVIDGNQQTPVLLSDNLINDSTKIQSRNNLPKTNNVLGINTSGAYVLTVQDTTTTTDFSNSTAWVTSTNGPIIVLGPGSPKTAYLDNPGIYNIVIHYPPVGGGGVRYIDYWVFKEGISVNQGLTTVTSSKNDAKNLLTLYATRANGTDFTRWITTRLLKLHYLPNNDDLFTNFMVDDDLSDYYPIYTYTSNISSNFSLQTVLTGPGYDPVGITQVFYFNATNISASKRFSNTVSDFQKMPVIYNPDKSLTVSAAIGPCLWGYCSLGRLDSGVLEIPTPKITIPGTQMLYTLIPPQDQASYFAGYTTSFTTWGPETGPIFTTGIPAQRFLRPGWWAVSSFPTNTLPQMIERKVYVGLGPSYWAGTFQNSPNLVQPLPYYDAIGAMFLRQDYTMKSYSQSGQITYTIPTATGGTTSVNGGSFPAYKNSDITKNLLTPVTLPVAGPVKMTATFPYIDNGQSLNSNIVASFDTSKSDPNPPAFKRLYYYANNARSEVYDPTVADRIEFELDPVSGTMGTVTSSYATDGITFKSLTTTNSGGIYSASIPGSLTSSSSKIDIDIHALDSTGNYIDYDFQLPFGNAPQNGGTLPKPGDLNSDGQVDITDLQWSITNFTNIFNVNLIIANYGK